MELVYGISLLSYIKQKSLRKCNEKEALHIFLQIIEGINYLHLKGICHRDIKLENIIINPSGKIKIIDFGFASYCNYDKLMNFFCGTPSYMPPEIVNKEEYIGFYADIWSLGVLLFTLLSGTFPYRGVTEKELYSRITKAKFTCPTYFSDNCIFLINKMLETNPHNRPNCDQVNYYLFIDQN